LAKNTGIAVRAASKVSAITHSEMRDALRVIDVVARASDFELNQQPGADTDGPRAPSWRTACGIAVVCRMAGALL